MSVKHCLCNRRRCLTCRTLGVIAWATQMDQDKRPYGMAPPRIVMTGRVPATHAPADRHGGVPTHRQIVMAGRVPATHAPADRHGRACPYRVHTSREYSG